jgi:ankyrin repeat protein
MSNSPAYALHKAARENDVREIVRLHKAGSHLEECDRDGRTPLMAALHAGQLEAVRVLLILGAHTQWIGYDEQDAFSSVPFGRFDLYWALITHDTHYAQDERGAEALHSAVWENDRVVVNALLDESVAVNAAARWWGTDALGTAVNLSNYSWAREHDTTSGIGYTDDSVVGDYHEMIALLLERGANVHFDNDRVIRASARYGNSPVVEMLRQYGANYGICEAAAIGDAESVGRFLAEGINIDTQWDEDLRETPLTLAAGRGHAALVALLLERGANLRPYPAEHNGFQPLACAVGARHYDCTVLLCKHGAATDNSDAFIGAVLTGEERMLRLLIDSGVPLNEAGSWGRTALQIAEEQEQTALAELLRAHGAKDFPQTE